MSEPQDLAEALARTLDRAAGFAPAPPADLLARVEERYRRRHGTLIALAAALAVLVVLAAAIGTARAFNRPAPVATHPDPTSVGQLGWVRALPARVDGDSYQIVDKLPDDRFLAIAARVSGGIQRERLLLLTVPRSGVVTSKVIYQTQGTGATVAQIFHATSNEHWLAWSVQSSKGTTLVYTMSTAKGGKPKAVLNLGSGLPGVLTLGGDRLYYVEAGPSHPDPRLLSLPAGGGAATPVPATAGDRTVTTGHILWPWFLPMPENNRREGQPGAHTNYRAVNLVTGETRRAKFTGAYGSDFCSPQWCETGGAAPTSKAVVIQRFDGSATHSFPGFLVDQVNYGWNVLLLDRYLPAWRQTGGVTQLDLLDAKTGRTLPVATAGGLRFSGGANYLTWFVQANSAPSAATTQYVLVPW